MKHEESKHDDGSRGTTILIHVVPGMDIDTLVSHVREVVQQIVAASADHVTITGNIEIMDESQAPLDPEPEPPETNYKFPPFEE